MRAVLFKDSEGKQAHALGLLNALAEITGSQLLPAGGELRLRVQSGSSQEAGGDEKYDFAKHASDLRMRGAFYRQGRRLARLNRFYAAGTRNMLSRASLR